VSGKCVCFGMREHVLIQWWPFPIKKIINTELLIERTAALYLRESQIRVGTSEGDQTIELVESWNECTMRWNVMWISKVVAIRDQVSTCLEMSLAGLWNKQSIVLKILHRIFITTKNIVFPLVRNLLPGDSSSGNLITSDILSNVWVSH